MTKANDQENFKKMKHFTKDEDEFLVKNYAANGNIYLSSIMNRSVSSLGKRARALGLYKTAEGRVIDNKNKWQFTRWSYELGYLVGVYLGDGNIRNTKKGCHYFRLSVTDLDFAEATQFFLKKETGHDSSLTIRTKEHPCQNQYTVTLANKDFVNWIEALCGPANYKVIPTGIPVKAIKGVVEGLFDSEGTDSKTGISLRMHTDLIPFLEMCSILDLQRTNSHGQRLGLPKININNKILSQAHIPLNSIHISYKELEKANIGTYIERKARVSYPFLCYNNENQPREL